MSVADRWTRPGPDGARVRTAEWGQGYRWQARWRDEAGRQRAKRCRTKDEAQAVLDDLTRRAAAGQSLDLARSRTTVAAYAERWQAGAGEKASARAWNAGALDGHILPRWGTTQVGAITTAQVRDWAAELAAAPNGRGGTLSASRRRGLLLALGAILQHAVDDRAIAVNPARGVDLPRVRAQRWTPPAEEQVLALYDALREQYEGSEMAALVESYAGLRWAELVALDVTDLVLTPSPRLLVDDAIPEVQGRLEPGATKTHAVRTAPLPRFLADRLTFWVDGRTEGPLIPGPRGGRFRASTWRRHWVAATEAAGLAGMRPHQLRHLAASRAIGAGADVKVVQGMLGHASGAMTLDVYGHLLADRTAEVAAAMDRYAPPASAEAAGVRARRLRAV